MMQQTVFIEPDKYTISLRPPTRILVSTSSPRFSHGASPCLIKYNATSSLLLRFLLLLVRQVMLIISIAVVMQCDAIEFLEGVRKLQARCGEA